MKKKANNVKKNSSDEVTKLVEMILIILVVFAAFYILTTFVTKKQNKISADEVSEPQNNIIQYDEILLSNIFEQKNDEYYVVVLDENSNYKESIDFYIQTYNQKEDKIRLYTSSINENLNGKYKSNNSKLDVDNINDLKIKTITLLKIKDKKIEYSIEGEMEVNKKMAELSK